MRARHIAFDLDGTLLDTREQIARSLYDVIPAGRRDADTLKALRKRTALSPLAVLKNYQVRSLDNYWRCHARNVHHALPCTPAIVADLKSGRADGLSFSILTSLPKHAATNLLDHHGLSHLFDRIDGAGSLSSRKPSPSALLEHLSLVEAVAADAAYVGDSAKDMSMAIKAGVYPVGVEWSSEGAEALKQAGAKMILAKFSDLLKL